MLHVIFLLGHGTGTDPVTGPEGTTLEPAPLSPRGKAQTFALRLCVQTVRKAHLSREFEPNRCQPPPTIIARIVRAKFAVQGIPAPLYFVASLSTTSNSSESSRFWDPSAPKREFE
jgi:hypothetical protein